MSPADARKRFSSLRALTALDEARTATELGARMRHLRAKRAELERMRAYSEEYRSSQRHAALDGARWRNLQSFTAQLDSVVSQLESELDRCVRSLGEEMERWRRVYRRGKAFDGLVEQYRRELAAAIEGAEQRELDERAARGSEAAET